MPFNTFNLSRRSAVHGIAASLFMNGAQARISAPSSIVKVGGIQRQGEPYCYANCWQSGNNRFGITLKTLTGQESQSSFTLTRSLDSWIPEWLGLHESTANGQLATQPMIIRSDPATAMKVLRDVVSVIAVYCQSGLDFQDIKRIVECSSANPVPMAVVGTGDAHSADAALGLAFAQAGIANGNGLRRAKSALVVTTTATAINRSEHVEVMREYTRLLVDEENLALGKLIDSKLGDAYRVSVLATI